MKGALLSRRALVGRKRFLVLCGVFFLTVVPADSGEIFSVVRTARDGPLGRLVDLPVTSYRARQGAQGTGLLLEKMFGPELEKDAVLLKKPGNFCRPLVDTRTPPPNPIECPEKQPPLPPAEPRFFFFIYVDFDSDPPVLFFVRLLWLLFYPPPPSCRLAVLYLPCLPPCPAVVVARPEPC